jgi:hypothetical protein
MFREDTYQDSWRSVSAEYMANDNENTDHPKTSYLPFAYQKFLFMNQ